MNSTLEAISNSISISTPAMISGAQPGSGSRGVGGFASTLAAAQGVSTNSATPTVSVPGGNTVGIAAPLNVAGKAGENFPAKKPLSSTAPVIASNNNVIAGLVALPAGPVLGAGLETNPLTSLTEVTTFQNDGVVGARVPASWVARSSASGLQEPASLSSPEIGAEPISGTVHQSSAGVSPPDQIRSQPSGPLSNQPSNQPNGQEPSLGNNVPLPVVTSANATADVNAISPGTASGSQPNRLTDEPPPMQPTLLAENSNPPAISFANEQQSTDTVTPRVQGNGPQAGGVEPEPAEAAAHTFQTAHESTTAVPVLLADAFPQSGPMAEVQTSETSSIQIGQESNSPDAAVVSAFSGAVSQSSILQSNVEPPQGIGNLLAGITSGQAPAPSSVNAQSEPLPGRGTLRPIAPKVGAEVTAASVPGQSTGVSSIPTSAAATDSGEINGLPLTTQTPFSVFFSSPGPGTESAASALPKMILPVASAASHSGGFAVATGAWAGSASTAGWQSNAAQPAASQTKDSLSATPPSGLQVGPALHAEPSAASSPAVVPQAAAVAGAAATPATLNVPLVAPAAVPGDSQPKQDIPQGAASGGPASLVPAAAQAPSTAAPGPVQVAQLVNRIGQSEMRVGMNTSAFGNVEVRTVVHANDVGLMIGSEKGDLRGLLTNDLPAIANTLQQQNLRLNNVNFMSGFAFSNNSSGGGDSQQRSFVPTQVSMGFAPSSAAPEDSVEVLSTSEFGRAGNGLSILA